MSINSFGGLSQIDAMIEALQIQFANSLLDVDEATVKAAGPLVNVEAASVIEIGKLYLVNVGGIDTSKIEGMEKVGLSLVLPLLGDRHIDREIEKDIPEHWHVDFRFTVSPMHEVICRTFESNWIKSHGVKPYDVNFHLAMVVNDFILADKPRRKALICQRHHSLYNKKAAFLPKLERMYLSKRVSCGRCPHKEISLNGAPEDKNGGIVCPGHGLRWNKFTGALMPRRLG